MTWLNKLKPTKGAAYIKGNALPESDHETATGRALYTITAIRKAYDAGLKEGSGSQGFNLCVDGVHIPEDVVKKAVFLYMTGNMFKSNCRLCHYYAGLEGCAHNSVCTNADKYQPADKVVLWKSA